MNDNQENPFSLGEFFPFRLSKLDTAVSQAVSHLYTGRFGLSRPEWRILAVLGTNASMSAKDIASFTNLEKMQVSRAISRLKREELINQKEDPDDRRYTRLSLAEKGVAVYKKLVPLVAAREEYILSALTEEEQQELATLMEKVYNKAFDMQQWG